MTILVFHNLRKPWRKLSLTYRRLLRGVTEIKLFANTVIQHKEETEDSFPFLLPPPLKHQSGHRKGKRGPGEHGKQLQGTAGSVYEHFILFFFFGLFNIPPSCEVHLGNRSVQTKCCHTEMEATDQTCYLAPSQCTDTRSDPVKLSIWQSSHLNAN